MKVFRLVLRHGAGERPLRHIERDGAQIPTFLYEYLVRHGRMSHQVSLAVRLQRAECVLEDTAEDSRSDNKPI